VCGNRPSRARSKSMIPRSARGRADPSLDALRFTFSHWSRHKRLTAATAFAMMAMTLVEVATPVFAGRLVEAIAEHGPNSLAAALDALTWLIGLAGGAIVIRHLGFIGITALTTRTMAAIGAEAFARVQRFSTDWHANNFAGSTVRKVSRGMWALDLLGDTLMVALLPSLVVLLGSTALLAWQWPVMGLAILAGAMLYVALTVGLSLAYVAPAARLANLWDTRVGGALADAISCNAVVKAFGAEEREDGRLVQMLGRWRQRTRRVWQRGTNAGTAQQTMLLGLRAIILGGVVWLWVQGRAGPGEVAFVLGTYALVHGYLRDIGMHIHNLQRSINDMEDLVALGREPFGVLDRRGAKPLEVRQGRIAFDRVTFHYSGHSEALYRHLSITIAAGERVGLVGR
jgi:ATP-binding cassette subfamily B protein